jgi:hypothetical protein
LDASTTRARILTLVLGLPSDTAAAQPVNVMNSGFESSAMPQCGFGVAATAWIATGDGGVWRPGIFGQCLNSYRNGPPEGVQIAYINGGTLTQTLAATLTANTQYTLRVKAGRRFDCCQSGSGADYLVQLRAGGVVLREDAGSLAITNGTFRLTTLRFSTGATHAALGQPLQIRLLQGGNGQANFDDVQVESAPADCNNNGIFDAIDIANGTPDINGNGVPDACELGQCPADVAPAITGNGMVNIDDLLAVIGQWGACQGCAADIAPAHGNAAVNIDDLLAVIGAWGPCSLP